MKRQRKREGPTTAVTGKKNKKLPVDAEERQPEPPVAVEESEVMLAEELGWGWWLKGGEVDERMSWGSVWLPVWDVEFVGENYGALFSDVQWDDDIWNLKGVTQVPP